MQRLAVVARPGRGFALCGVVMLLYSAIFGLNLEEQISFALFSLFGVRGDQLGSAIRKLEYSGRAFVPMVLDLQRHDLINIMWGLLNLLPIWPLDGGQITGVVLAQLNPAKA